MDCDGVCVNDADGDGICDDDEVAGCTDAGACNYNADATDDDGSCQFADAYAQGYDAGYADGLANCETADNSCPEDLDGDGEVATSDLLIFLSAFASSCD